MTLEKVKQSVVESNYSQIIFSKRVRAQITPWQFIEFIAIIWCQLKAQNIFYIELLSQHQLTVLTLSFNLQPNFAIILPFHLLCHTFHYLSSITTLNFLNFRVSSLLNPLNLRYLSKIPLLFFISTCFLLWKFLFYDIVLDGYLRETKNSVDYYPEKCLGSCFFSLI